MRTIVKAARGLVVVDEAYHEFSRQSAVPLLHEFEHLVVLRTFSKAMAMAGLRVGYLLGHPPVGGADLQSQTALQPEHFFHDCRRSRNRAFSLLQPQIELLIQERERLLAELQQTRGVTAYPSQANFIAFKTQHSAAQVFEALYSKGILVRDISRYPMLENFLRVSVGCRRKMTSFSRVA